MRTLKCLFSMKKKQSQEIGPSGHWMAVGRLVHMSESYSLAADQMTLVASWLLLNSLELLWEYSRRYRDPSPPHIHTHTCYQGYDFYSIPNSFRIAELALENSTPGKKSLRKFQMTLKQFSKSAAQQVLIGEMWNLWLALIWSLWLAQIQTFICISIHTSHTSPSRL